MYRVLFLGWEYYPVFSGGLGVVCTAMANEMADQDLEVYVVLPSLPKELPASNVTFAKPSQEYSYKVNSKNITVKVHSVEMNPYSSAKSNSEEHIIDDKDYQVSRNKRSTHEDELYEGDLFQRVSNFRDMVSDLVLDLEFDVIHAHDWMTFLAAIEAKNVSKKKCVLHVHATELDRTGDNPNDFILNIEKTMLAEANRVLAVSEHTKNLLVDKYNIDTNKIKVLHNALAMEHCHDINYKLNLGKSKIVAFLGRLVVQKGVESFLLIAQKVIEKLPDTIFVIAGSGPLEDKLMEMACELDIHKNIYFAGRVSRLEGDVIYKNADLYLMTSGSEPFGITGLESINQGTPIIVTKTSGIKEAIPNAISIDYWDIDKFADYTINLLSDDVFHQFLLDQQSNDFKKISWKKQVNKLIEVYHELLAE